MKATKKTVFSALSLAGVLVTGYMLVYAATSFEPDNQPVGYVGMPEVTNNIVTSGTEKLFAIDYSSQDWSGNLHSFPLSSTGAVSTLDDWTDGAAGQIDLQNYDTGRLIVTNDGNTGITFRWASLTASQKTALDSATAAITTATTSPVLDYIRGDRSNEKPNGLNYRERGSVLGDMIHSTPVYCKAADCSAATVFVGANDGMLHAINASTGAERFAYIPSLLIPKLSQLKADPYTHKYFVDGNLDLRKFGSTTVLVGTLGAGGRGLFALNVSNAAPANETEAKAKLLWEITNSTTGFANLGYTYGTPRLATLSGGINAVIIGNGYNNTGNGHASLFIINATSGALIAEIDTGSGSSGSPNGLSSPTLIDTDVDGDVDYAYAGDIDGHLWKFDLSANTATLLLTTSPAQAITMAPGIKSHPSGGFMVTFATGRMFTNADETDNSTHYAYGIWDGAPAANDTLLNQTLTATEHTETGVEVRSSTNNLPDWTAGAGHHKGWKTALPVGGERVVGDGAYVTGSVFLFLSTNPTINPTGTPPGENWWMQLNALTGGDNGAVRFDLNGDNQFNSADQLSGGISPVGRHIGGGVRSQLTALSASGLDVYQANYDKNGDPPAPPSITEERGVSGGHFDFDLYCYNNRCNDEVGNTAGQYYTGTNSGVNANIRWTHVHEYDDIYDKTGVNMLNASQTLLNLGKAMGTTTSSSTSTVVSGNHTVPASTTITKEEQTTQTKFTIVKVTSTYSSRRNRTTTTTETIVSTIPDTTQFKILVANQAYSPAAKISVGGNDYVNVTSYGTASGLTVASLPSYNFKTIETLALNLPLDAFKSKDWGTGVVRAGLHPLKWSCAVRDAIDGPSGERRNGALLVQVVKASTANSDVQLNVSGHPELGYRLKNTSMSSKLLAEYTMFWHHPNDKCMADSGWSMAPPEDTVSDAVAADPATGSADPADGTFGISEITYPGTDGGSGGTGGGTGGSGGSGGSGTTGSGITTGIVTGGQVDVDGVVFTGGVTTPPEVLGRVNWRELRQ